MFLKTEKIVTFSIFPSPQPKLVPSQWRHWFLYALLTQHHSNITAWKKCLGSFVSLFPKLLCSLKALRGVTISHMQQIILLHYLIHHIYWILQLIFISFEQACLFCSSHSKRLRWTNRNSTLKHLLAINSQFQSFAKAGNKHNPQSSVQLFFFMSSTKCYSKYSRINLLILEIIETISFKMFV